MATKNTDVIRWAEAHGWTAQRTRKNHVKLTLGPLRTIVPVNIGCPRGPKNAIAEMTRMMRQQGIEAKKER